MALTVSKVLCYTTCHLIGLVKDLILLRDSILPNNFYKLLTSRFYWHHRLIVCGSAALLFSLCTWLLGIDIVWQLLSVVVGFLLGFLWPIRYSKRKSLDWLDENIGLSYRTLLELPPNQKETLGFKVALQKRSEFLIAQTKLPQILPWWLLLLGLALGITFLPNINLPTAVEATYSLIDDFSEQVARAYDEETKNQQNLQDSTEKTVESGEDLPFENQGSNFSTSRTNSETGSEPTPTTNNEFNPTLVDNEVLEQFLENGNQTKEGPANPFQSIESSPPQKLTETIESDQQVNSSEDLQSADPPLISNQPQTPLDSAVSQTESEDQQSASNENSRLDEDTQADNDSELEQTGNNANSENQQSQRSENNSEEVVETTEATEVEDTQSDNEQIGQQQDSQSIQTVANPSQGDNTAGNSASASNPSESLETSSNETTHLEGKLIDGPSNLAGEISLPGETEANFPQEDPTPNNNFQYFAEEAITEGSIPLEYQEILRNYFR